MNKNVLDEITPGELYALLTNRGSVIDSDKSIRELSVGELIILQHHPDELERYYRDRIKKLKAKLSKMEELESRDNAPINELLQEYYGRLT